jgi:hypothetical protein
MLLGWLITLLAVSLGAPFWFDVLTKVSNLRSSGPRGADVTGRFVVALPMAALPDSNPLLRRNLRTTKGLR